MWFMFGLVTLAGTAAAMGYRRFKPPMPSKPGNRGFRYREVVNSKTQQQTSVQVAVPVSTTLAFECKPETWFDRTCKAMGLAVEHQANDKRFDEAIYVLSDDARVRSELLADAALREAMLGLFKDRMFAGAITLKQVRCRDGMLVADYRCGGGASMGVDRMGGVAERLKHVAALLPPKTPNARIGDSLFFRSVLVLALSTALAITGGLNLFRLLVTNIPYTVDAGALFAASLTLGAVALCLMVLAPAIRETVVADKHMYRGRRGRRSYYLALADWNDGKGTRRIRVPSAIYQRMTIGARAQVVQHPGRFGMRWVSDIKPASE